MVMTLCDGGVLEIESLQHVIDDARVRVKASFGEDDLFAELRNMRKLDFESEFK